MKPYNNDTWKEAKKQKYKVRKLLKGSKRNFICRSLKNNQNNTKKYWKTVTSVIKPKSREYLDGVICPRTNTKMFGIEAANLINQYFCGIGEKLANGIQDVNYLFPAKMSNVVEFVWSQEIREDEVKELVLKLDIEKSSGIPKLGSRILKECLIQTIPVFTKLLNICVRVGKFPEEWKRAVVVPIPKGNKEPTLGNIRPISLWPYPGKVFEQIIHKRVYRYLELNSLLCSEQSGFRKNFSTSDPVLDLTTEVSKAFNEGKGVICIYIDMAKAFNSLNPCLLLNKIKNLGFKGNILQLFNR